MAAVETSLPANQQGLFTNQDLFDDGCDDNSSGEEESRPVSPSGDLSQGHNNDTPNNNSIQVKPKRKQRTEKIPKPKKSDIRKMHSETQRLIRESSVNLPKFQPKIKTLDGFLTKLKKNTSGSSSVLSSERENMAPPPPFMEEQKTVVDNSVEKIVNLQEPRPLNDSNNSIIATEADHTPLPHPVPLPKLHSFDSLEVEIKTETTPIEELKTRFVKHATLKSTSNKVKKPVIKEDILNTPKIILLSEDETSQPGLAPGAIRQKLKQKLQKQILKLKAQDRKMYEERRKMDEEEMDEELDELSKLEAQLGEEDMSEGEDTDNEDKEWKRESRETKEEKKFEGTSDNENEEGSDDEGSDDIDEEGSDNNDEERSDSEDDMCFTSSWAVKRKRFIESDEEEDNQVTENKSNQRTNDNEITTHKPTNNLPSNTDTSRDSESCDASKESHDTDEDSHDVIKDLHVHQSIEDAASMGPLIFNEGTIDHTETLDYPIVTRILPHPLNEDSQQTELVNEDYEDLEMSFQIGPSLPPPHQEPMTTMTGFMAMPSMTRQSSTVSDKDVLRGLEAHPPRMPTQLLSNTEGMVEEETTQFLDANGFLCIRDKTKLKSSFSAIKQLTDMDSGFRATPTTQQVMDLCSGATFQSKPPGNNKKATSLLLNNGGFDDNTTSDVIGLCSGAFPATGVQSSLLTHNDHNRDSSSSDDEEAMPMLKRKRRRKIIKPKNKERLQEFVESEAELSGSDFGEDNDEEDVGGVSEDTYEDEGEGSDVPLSDSELKDQVNQAHLKQLAVDDKAEIRNIQERFLLEGDLYEDGLQMKNGFFRTRRFIQGSETSQDLFAEEKNLDINEDDSGIPMESQQEAKRRKERLEKEEFIQRNTESRSLLEFDEDSQNILGLIRETSNNPCTPLPSHVKSFTTPRSATPAAISSSSSHKKNTRGSFMNHKKLERLASTPQLSGTGSGRGYVFQTGVADTTTTSDKAKPLSFSSQKPQKRPCYNRTISLPSSSSIFDKLT